MRQIRKESTIYQIAPNFDLHNFRYGGGIFHRSRKGFLAFTEKVKNVNLPYGPKVDSWTSKLEKWENGYHL